MIRTGFQAQSIRIANYWEPRVSGVLTGMADAVRHDLYSVIERYSGNRPRDSQLAYMMNEITIVVNNIAHKQSERATSMLVEMISQETTEALEIMTINGLTMETPALDFGNDLDQTLAGRLAGGGVLRIAVTKSANDFLAKVGELLTSDMAQPVEADATMQRFEVLVDRWRSRLATIAATVVHGVFNRSKMAVNQAISQAAE